MAQQPNLAPPMALSANSSRASPNSSPGTPGYVSGDDNHAQHSASPRQFCASCNRISSISFFTGCYCFVIPVLLGVCATLKNLPYFSLVFLGAILGFIGFLATYRLIPKFMFKSLSSNLCGEDLNKMKNPKSKKLIPEALGIVPGVIFMLVVIVCQLLFSHEPSKLLEYNAGLLSICFMTFLGFADDVLNLPWRYKMTLPAFAALPLLLAYNGSTTILLPDVLKPYFSLQHLDLGYLYHVYMGMLTIFCTNSINIYAGINGLEAGQSVVMSLFIIIHNLWEILSNTDNSSLSGVVADQHFFSLLLSMPFYCTAMGLLCYNWYPSRVFVGDTFTYFAGIYFAVVGILGHFSKTLLLFFIPQLINFVISLPQLFGLIECPRHRVPRINPQTGKLHATANYTLINMTLRFLGPMTEERLVKTLLGFQATCCVLGLAIRYSPLYGLFL